MSPIITLGNERPRLRKVDPEQERRERLEEEQHTAGDQELVDRLAAQDGPYHQLVQHYVPHSCDQQDAQHEGEIEQRHTDRPT